MLSVVRYVLAGVAVAAYAIAAWSPGMPEDIWRMLAAGVVVGLASGAWWALAVALVVVGPVLGDGINDDDISDFELILIYMTVGALSIALGVGIAKLAGVLSRKRGSASASKRA